MARLFDDASSHDLVNASAVVTAYPFTFGCWFRSDTTTVNQTLISVADTAGADDWARISLTSAGLARIQAEGQNDGVRTADSTTGFSADTWHYAAGVFTSVSALAVYLDGGSKGTNSATGNAFAGMDTTAIGVLKRSTEVQYMSGRIAEPVIYNVALSDAEVVVLYKFGPWALPYMPVAYWHLWGNDSPEPDVMGTYNLTVTGATKTDHPPVWFPGRAFNLGVPAAAAGQTVGTGLTSGLRLQRPRLMA